MPVIKSAQRNTYNPAIPNKVNKRDIAEYISWLLSTTPKAEIMVIEATTQKTNSVIKIVHLAYF